MMNKQFLRKLDDTDFYAVIQETLGASIVFFSNEGCNSCRYWKALLDQLAGTRPTLNIFEVDAQQSMGLTREYEVFHLPSLFVFVNGQYHAPLQCEARLDTIDHSLDKVLAAPAQDAP
ncbi:MAG: thioredoxin family protein [Gammaproteobacteria bacterium]|jgi:thioredoxin 1